MECFRKGELSLDEIKQWLVDLRSHSYVPISDFCVSAIVRVEVGANHYYFPGVNIENIDHALSIHAEESAISIMITALGNAAKIKDVWVMGAPRAELTSEEFCTCCGKCRQHISEFADSNALINYVTLSGDVKVTSVGDVLPESFSLRDHDNRKYIKRLSLQEIENNLIRRDVTSEQIVEWLKNLEVVDFISGTSKRVVIKLSNGAYVAGASMESSAFLSVSAIQSAIATAIIEFKNINIEEVHLISVAKGDKKLEDNQFIPLSLAEIQVLREFATSDDIPVNIYTEGGRNISVTMLRNVMFSFNSKKTVHEV